MYIFNQSKTKLHQIQSRLIIKIPQSKAIYPTTFPKVNLQLSGYALPLSIQS